MDSTATAAPTSQALSSATATLVELSPEELHRFILEAYELEGTVRVKLLRGLHAFELRKFGSRVGSGPLLTYIKTNLKRLRSVAYEVLNVSRIVDTHPRLIAAYEEGAICWSSLVALVEITP